ncbi:MAG TPA: lytic transglycosylase domain-containing protein [Pyrinomonadaceae bacterium]|jgi:hypothetical protein
MTRLVLLSAFVLLVAPVAAQAQKGNLYHFDNFDTSNGVKIETAPVQKTAPPKSKLRLTAHTSARGAAMTGDAQPRESVSGLAAAASSVAMKLSRSLDGFTTGNSQVDGFIVASGSRHGVDPVLLYAIMHRESAFKQRAISYKGARGLMQLMPATAARFGVSNIFDPQQNIEGGARYMRYLLNFFDGDVALALAGYNAGEGAVLKYGRRVPPYSETREYVRRISQRYALMRDPEAARKAQTVSPAQFAAIKAAAPAEAPAPVYERNVYSVRLPNGQLMLHSQ